MEKPKIQYINREIPVCVPCQMQMVVYSTYIQEGSRMRHWECKGCGATTKTDEKIIVFKDQRIINEHRRH